MKNYKMLFVFVIGIILSIGVCEKAAAFELWNGFTTEMTKDQVIARAREVLRISGTPYERTDDWAVGINPFIPGGELGYINTQFQKPTLGVNVYSPLEKYDQYKDIFINSMSDNIFFYFFENKLCAVCIALSTRDSANAVALGLKRDVEEFGAYDEIFREKALIGSGSRVTYQWNRQNSIVFSSGAAIWHIDSKMYKGKK